MRGINITELYLETVIERRKPRASEKQQFHQFLQAEYAFPGRFRILLEQIFLCDHLFLTFIIQSHQKTLQTCYFHSLSLHGIRGYVLKCLWCI